MDQAQATVLPGKPERALRYEFVCKIGGPPEFRYCHGEWSKQVENVGAPSSRFALTACVLWTCGPCLQLEFCAINVGF